MNKRVLIFAGTIEGRKLAEYLVNHEVDTFVSVATSYGKSLYENHPNICIYAKRLDLEEMETFINEVSPDFIVDATHPYAKIVTENIYKVCDKMNKPYFRLIRQVNSGAGNEIYVSDIEEAAQILKEKIGNILLTTGSKELRPFTKIPEFEKRVYARVLSLPEVINECDKLGFRGKNLIGMQGPFSYELNKAMIHQLDIKYLVTKDTGSQGGFVEKCQAAEDSDIHTIIVGRPTVEEGLFLDECKRKLAEIIGFERKLEVSVVGIGMGNIGSLTIEAKKEIEEADLLVGAKRIVNSVISENQKFLYEYKAEKIKEYLEEHTEYEKAVIVFSGDIGFFSGAKKIKEILPVKKSLPGISSLVYFCAKTGIEWEDIKIVNLHGKNENLSCKIKENKRIFAILGKENQVSKICQELYHQGFGENKVYIGERLSYENEKIQEGAIKDFMNYQSDALAVVIIENKEPLKFVSGSIKDEEFIREKVPMTKEEIRTISIAKLRLQENSVVYDIGAGTGSVSVEIANLITDGFIYAIEQKKEAVELINKNKEKWNLKNLYAIESKAPEGLRDLPVPTHAFIGGTAGNMKDIITVLLGKNKEIRLVINAITLETIQETLNCIREFGFEDVNIVCIQVSKSKEAGSYHMMIGQNPVYIISCKKSR